jgi:hypothetical protein
MNLRYSTWVGLLSGHRYHTEANLTQKQLKFAFACVGANLMEFALEMNDDGFIDT